jgi:hypothetical protein
MWGRQLLDFLPAYRIKWRSNIQVSAVEYIHWHNVDMSEVEYTWFLFSSLVELTVEHVQSDVYVHIRCVTVHDNYEALSSWVQSKIFINHVPERFTRKHQI